MIDLAYTFRGGIRLDEYKNTKRCRIETLPAPEFVSIPLLQHVGQQASAIVNIGDRVAIGQKIGEAATELGCPIHASISGTVVDIVKRTMQSGETSDCIVIKNDYLKTMSPDIKPISKKLTDVTTDEIIAIVREAGIVGMGGTAYPTYAKLRSALGKVDKIIVNCAESEPFITSNHRLLLEQPAAVINGVKILLKTLGVRTAFIAVEDNKADAIDKLEEMTEGSRMISVKVMKSKYPEGDERQLVYALTGVEIPDGKLPTDVGCVVFNAETCAAIYRTFAYGTPLISRIITVDGDCVRRPRNVLAPIGTSVRDLIEFCGGLKREPCRIICGGPMMGVSITDAEMPVTKATNGVLVFSESFGGKNTSNQTCIRCGKCVQNCPVHLMPSYIAQFTKIGDIKSAEEYGAMSCIECGTCSYSCPGCVEIVQYIKEAKIAIKTEHERIAATEAAEAGQ